jgi:hypothetical protein
MKGDIAGLKLSKACTSWAWWHKPLMPVLRRVRQKYLGYTVRLYLKKQQQQQQQQKSIFSALRKLTKGIQQPRREEKH